MSSKVEQKPQDKKTDYSFLLKCMAGITACVAGFVVASVAVGAVASLGLIIGIGAACLVAFLFASSDSSSRRWGAFSPIPHSYPAYNVRYHTPNCSDFNAGSRMHAHRSSAFGGGTTHTHGGIGSSRTMPHSRSSAFGGGTTHTHGEIGSSRTMLLPRSGTFGGGATHTHGGGFFGAGGSTGVISGSTVHVHQVPVR
jgi:hypothetical protein